MKPPGRARPPRRGLDGAGDDDEGGAVPVGDGEQGDGDRQRVAVGGGAAGGAGAGPGAGGPGAGWGYGVPQLPQWESFIGSRTFSSTFCCARSFARFSLRARARADCIRSSCRDLPRLMDDALMTGIASAFRALAATAAVLLAATVASPPARAQAEPKAPAEFVALRSVDPTIIQEMRYPTGHNFMGEPVDGYRQPVCILTRPAAQALHAAQTRLLRQGYSLKVYDCYRPQRAVDHFVRWAKDLDDEADEGASSTRRSTRRGCSRTVTSRRSPGTAGAARST